MSRWRFNASRFGWKFWAFGIELAHTPAQFSRGQAGEVDLCLHLGPWRFIVTRHIGGVWSPQRRRWEL